MKKPDSKTAWDDKADRAIEIARSLPPGPDRHEAMKKAGLMRRMATLAEQIDRLEESTRGKRPR